MKILVIGGGGREHALVWKLSHSPQVDSIICTPGNAGIAELASCPGIPDGDIQALLELGREERPDLTLVGPEAPLARGITDVLEKEGLPVFGPRQEAAVLESSKVFAKDLMHKYGIPTAAYRTFTDPGEAKKYIKEKGTPRVIKADGLAAGKGVIVARDEATAFTAVDDIMTGRVFGAAGDRIVVEECLEGEEASVLAFTDGTTVLPMLPAQDHKQVYDRDEGPNTGGMGAYCPAPVCTPEVQQQVLEKVLKPTVQGMKAEGRPYKGVLYAGIMITPEGPRVLEYNVRFGDPEAQPLLMMLESDLVDIISGVVHEDLSKVEVKWKDGACVSVVLASGGYPGRYEKGFPISGLEKIPAGVEVFHAGTARKNGNVVTAGGRVLNVTAPGKDIPSAIEHAYRGVEAVHFEGMHYRTDIGKKALG